MSNKRPFERFSDDQQKQYEREARLQYGPQIVNESVNRWNSYSEARRDAIMAEGNAVYSDLAQAMLSGEPATSPAVQAILTRWHNHLRHFYEPTLDILRGLGELYNSNPAFIAFFDRLHPDLPQYLQDSIAQYVDDLEYAEIVRLLAQDEAERGRI